MTDKPSYLDENLSEGEKQNGQTRIPSPEREGEGHGKSAEQPYPGEEGRNDRNFERPDEFGDGDRRS
jgi:hypothetical protein